MSISVSACILIKQELNIQSLFIEHLFCAENCHTHISKVPHVWDIRTHKNLYTLYFDFVWYSTCEISL